MLKSVRWKVCSVFLLSCKMVCFRLIWCMVEMMMLSVLIFFVTLRSSFFFVRFVSWIFFIVTIGVW